MIAGLAYITISILVCQKLIASDCGAEFWWLFSRGLNVFLYNDVLLIYK